MRRVRRVRRVDGSSGSGRHAIGPFPALTAEASVEVMNGASRVLVCYATAAGSTREIAEHIAERIRTDLRSGEPAGPDVICREAGPDLVPDDYDALVIGSAVHDMSWLVAGEGARIERTFPAGFAPREHRVFGGVVVMTGLPLWGRLFWRLMGSRPGDHRNWPAIERWAAGIATELAVSGSGGARDGRADHRPQAAPAAADRASGRPSRGRTS